MKLEIGMNIYTIAWGTVAVTNKHADGFNLLTLHSNNMHHLSLDHVDKVRFTDQDLLRMFKVRYGIDSDKYTEIYAIVCAAKAMANMREKTGETGEWFHEPERKLHRILCSYSTEAQDNSWTMPVPELIENGRYRVRSQSNPNNINALELIHLYTEGENMYVVRDADVQYFDDGDFATLVKDRTADIVAASNGLVYAWRIDPETRVVTDKDTGNIIHSFAKVPEQ